MMPKSVSKLHGPHVLQTTPADMVLAKNSLNVKLENFHNSKVLELGKLCVPCLWGLGGFYSIESTPVSWIERSFLIERILINVRILQDSFHIGSPLTRATVGRKAFPFRISWNLLESCEHHVALVSVGLGAMYIEFVRIGGPSVTWSICPIPQFIVLFFITH